MPNNKTNKKITNVALWPVLLLLLTLFTVVGASAQRGSLFELFDYGVQGVKENTGLAGPRGIAGINGKDGANGLDGVAGLNGLPGAAGATGASGANGAAGAQGLPGSNDCISGICVSRQASTPGTQETGNINISGSLLTSQIGINDTTPSNTLTVNGTVDVQGHSAFGAGVTVNGGSTVLDSLAGTSSHSSVITANEILTSLNSATTAYDNIFGVVRLNPGSAPSYTQINGINGGIQVQSGNGQNFANQLNGINGVVLHAGTGTISTAYGGNYVIGNTGGGTITTANGFNTIGLNLNGTITNYRGINVATPINAGTVTNNYGLYINDQSSVGSTDSFNIYSAGSTAKNYFQGQVGIGATPNSTYKLDVNGVIRGTKFSGVSGSTTWLSSDGSNTGLFVTDAANPQTGANRSFHITTGAGESVPAFSVTGGGAANAVAVVKGAASQSANLQEWQNSAGTVLTSVSNSGAISGPSAFFGVGGGLNYGVTLSGGSMTNPFSPSSAEAIGTIAGNSATWVQGGSAGGLAVTTGNAIRQALIVKGAASQSANLQEWQNSSSTVLSAIDENGYLGIGTSDPQYELHVSQNAGWNTSLALTHTTPGKTFHISTTGGATSNWNLENANGLLYFANTSLSETSLELQDSGNVGIGTNFGSAGAKLHVKEDTDTTVLRLQDSDGTCDLNPESGSLTTTCSSDERLKSNIRDAASVLSEIKGLKIRDYTVIASGSETTGLIAQETLETNPGLVHMGEDGYYRVEQYNPWKVLKGIQELNTNAEDLQSTFTSALEKTNGDLSATNEILAALGLRVDTLSDKMQEFADRLAQAEEKIANQDSEISTLRAEIQALRQQLNSVLPSPATTE